MNIKPSFFSKFQGDFLCFLYLDCKSYLVGFLIFAEIFEMLKKDRLEKRVSPVKEAPGFTIYLAKFY